jgi:hypothetical protein
MSRISRCYFLTLVKLLYVEVGYKYVCVCVCVRSVFLVILYESTDVLSQCCLNPAFVLYLPHSLISHHCFLLNSTVNTELMYPESTLNQTYLVHLFLKLIILFRLRTARHALMLSTTISVINNRIDGDC